METYDDILNAILESVQGKTDAEFEDSLVDVLKNMGIPEEDISKVKESFMLLDATQDMANRLSEGRKDGVSRSSFVSRELDAITSDLTDDEKSQILEALVENGNSLEE